MYITLSPLRTDEPLAVSRTGDTLTINGQAIDLGPLHDGASLPSEAINSEWIVGPVSRTDGVLRLTLRLPHGPNPSPAVAFPEPMTVTSDGPIALPFDPPPATHGTEGEPSDD